MNNRVNSLLMNWGNQILELDLILRKYWDTIDFVKLTTAWIISEGYSNDYSNCFSNNEIQKIVKMCNEFWVNTYLWWWVIEDGYKNWNFNLNEFIKKLKLLWINTVEISNRYWLWISDKEYRQLIISFKSEFENILIEIWSKWANIPKNPYSDYQKWLEDIEIAEELWVNKIIVEWWKWQVWFYNKQGQVITLLLWIILEKAFKDFWKNWVIIEAYEEKSRNYLLNLFWSNINIWNIPVWLWHLKKLEPKRLELISILQQNEEKLWIIIKEVLKISKIHNINPNLLLFDNKMCNIDLREWLNKELYRELEKICKL